MLTTCTFMLIKKLTNLSRGFRKAPFSGATIPRYWGGHYSFPWIALQTFDQYLIMLSVKRRDIEYHLFESLVWFKQRLDQDLPDNWQRSSSSCRAASTDIPDPLSRLLPITSLLSSLQGYIPYPHIAAVCMFELVVLLLVGHSRGSIGVHHWWVRPCFSSTVLRVCFV